MNAATTSPALESARAEFRRMRDAVAQEHGPERTAKWVADVKARMADPRNASDQSPANWLAAAEVVTIYCGRCAGTGMFVTRVENGKPVGPGGSCYRCGGAGSQTVADCFRNATHDKHWFAREAAAMFA